MIFNREMEEKANRQDTRQSILNLLKREEMNVNELSARLGVSPTGTRQHLMILEKDGLIKSVPLKGAMGRPKYVYSLTEKADNLFPKAYDDFLEWVIEEIVELEGEKKTRELFQRIAKKRAETLKDQFEGKGLEEKIKLLTGLLDESGCYAEYSKGGNGYTIKEYNCVLKRLVGRYGSVVCAHDAAFFEALLGEKVKMKDSIGQGARFCAFEVRASQSPLSRSFVKA